MKRLNRANRPRLETFKGLIMAMIALTLLAAAPMSAMGEMGDRIVVLPFYVEEGRDAKEGGQATLHYRRILRFINNQLARHGFEVINPFAADASAREYNRVMERAREDSNLAAMEVCRKYGTDLAYITWLKVKRKPIPEENLCKARATLEGEGYDSAGRDLGASVSKTFEVSKQDCDDAIVLVEKEVADLVGRVLTRWSGGKPAATEAVQPAAKEPAAEQPVAVAPSAPVAEEAPSGGVLKRRSKALENVINVRLDGATEYELMEVFGKIVNTARGVVDAKRYSSRIVPDNPQASYMTWRVMIYNTDPFRLQANMMHMVNTILDYGGTVRLRGVTYRYTAGEVDLLMGIRPGDATSREIQFIVDRERARDREFSETHDPYKGRQKTSGGFD